MEYPPRPPPPSEVAPLRLFNPFQLRIAQVMTGFGIGCGVGIGVGRPLNLGAIPGFGQVAGEATRSLGTIGQQVHGLVKKLGIKNLEVGIGCGVGLGHGFGVGVTLKPGVAQKLKLLIEQGFSALMVRVRSVAGGDATDLRGKATGIASGNEKLLVGGTTTGQIDPTDVLGSRLHNTSMASSKPQPVVDSRDIDTEVNRLRAENRILQTLLRHQEQIEELKKQNANLQHLLEEELKSHSKKMESAYIQKDTEISMREMRLSNKCWKCRRHAHQRGLIV